MRKKVYYAFAKATSTSYFIITYTLTHILTIFILLFKTLTMRMKRPTRIVKKDELRLLFRLELLMLTPSFYCTQFADVPGISLLINIKLKPYPCCSVQIFTSIIHSSSCKQTIKQISKHASMRQIMLINERTKLLSNIGAVALKGKCARI